MNHQRSKDHTEQLDFYKKEIVKVVHLMYQRQFIAASDGNVSALLDDGNVITTPSGIPKGLINEDDLVIVNRHGEKIAGAEHLQPSSELKMHLRVYELRSDVRAIVHAHPPITTAFSVANVRLSDVILPETIFTLGMIEFSEYATPTTEKVAESISEAVVSNDVIVLTRHGSLTVGKTLMEAFSKLDSLEHTCKIICEAMKISGVVNASSSSAILTPLPAVEVERLREIKRKISERGKCQNGNGRCKGCPENHDQLCSDKEKMKVEVEVEVETELGKEEDILSEKNISYIVNEVVKRLAL
ncbi:MAG: class II aldolase/adducin family protein [Oligoflexia bacterium]|nr:class II aldolase/adducin family protein [Oligoflexia bacterium]